MGGHSQNPQYSGIDKFPGTIATVITLVVGAIFLGGLYREYQITASHHGEHHEEAGDHAAPAEGGGDHAEGEGGH